MPNILIKGIKHETQKLLCGRLKIGGMCATFAMDYLGRSLSKQPITPGTYDNTHTIIRIAKEQEAIQKDADRNDGKDDHDVEAVFGIRISNTTILGGAASKQTRSTSPTSSDNDSSLPAAAAASSIPTRQRSNSAPTHTAPSASSVGRPTDADIVKLLAAAERTKHWYVSCTMEKGGKLVGHAFAVNVTEAEKLCVADAGAGVIHYEESTVQSIVGEHLKALEDSIGPCVGYSVKGVSKKDVASDVDSD